MHSDSNEGSAGKTTSSFVGARAGKPRSVPVIELTSRSDIPVQHKQRQQWSKMLRNAPFAEIISM
jgi:hypothetical protein